MSTLTVTNVSATPLWLRDLYTELSPGESATITRTPAEMGDMIGLQEYLAEGKVEVNITLDSHEAPSELVSVWPLGLNWRPVVPTVPDLPTTKNRLGDVRMVLSTLGLHAWNGSAWVSLGGGGGGGVASVGGTAPIASSGGANPVISLQNSGVAADTYGDTTHVAQITVSAKGLVTSASEVEIPLPVINVPNTTIAVGDGVGLAGSTDLAYYASELRLEVTSTVSVTNGGNTLTLQPAFVGTDAATLSLDAGTTVQVGGVANVSINGQYTLPTTDGTEGQVLTTDGAGAVSWAGGTSNPLPAFILSTGAIQTISASTDQLIPVAPLHRVQTDGSNYALTSTPQINFPDAQVGQVLIIQNVGTANDITLSRGVAQKLSLSNSNKKIGPGGTMMLVFNGTLWVEVAHVETTST